MRPKRKQPEPPRAKRGSIEVRLLVGLPAELHGLLVREAKRAGLSRSELLRLALQHYLTKGKQ